jgi:CMP-N,N'-diacetyllegionaminic acid synthase
MRTIVSCDFEQLADVAHAEGVDVPFLCPAELASDDVHIPRVVQHAMRYCDGEGWRDDLVNSVRPTSPLLNAASIDAALKRMIEDRSLDSAVSVTPILKFHPFRSYRLEEDYVLLPLTEYTAERYL